MNTIYKMKENKCCMCTLIFLVHEESCMYHIRLSWNFGSLVKWQKCTYDYIAITRWSTLCAKLKKLNPLNPGQFTRICTAYPERSSNVYQYQYRFCQQHKSKKKKLCFTYLFTIYILLTISATYSPFCLKIQFFDSSHDYNSSTSSVTSSEYQYLHLR